jgi:hypothetical protein
MLAEASICPQGLVSRYTPAMVPIVARSSYYPRCQILEVLKFSSALIYPLI